MIRIVYIAALVALFNCVSYAAEDTNYKQAIEETIKAITELKNKKIDYISDYCMTSDFQNTIKDLLKLKINIKSYKELTNDSDLLESFDVIGYIIDDAVKKHMDRR